MEAPALVSLLQEAVPGAEIDPAPTIDLQTTFYVGRDRLPEVASALRDHPDLAFAVLAELTAVDYYPREPRFEVVYLLVSIERSLRARMKVRLAGGDARLASLVGIWPAANWLEREVWDLFGIAFDRHPDPRRLLMPEDWEGHPLRKDYPVQIRMTPQTAQPIQVTEDEFRASLERDRLSRS
jgi:NADH-quinone oxidoreductase subunit C